MSLSRPVRIILWTALGAAIAVAATFAILIYRFQPLARGYILSALRQRYHSDVELGDLHITLWPSVHATGTNLVLRLSGRRDIPALVAVKRFTMDASLAAFFRNPKRIAKLTLEGTEIHVPPRSGPRSEEPGAHKPPNIPFVLGEVVADGTRLESLPADPSKDPLVFHIQRLTLHTVGIGRPMSFHAELENPKPPGLIRSDGRFGPWEATEPSQTPVDGQYTFRDADLGVFHGIAGILSSDGKYAGKLDRIEVSGTTDTPDFGLSTGARRIALHTEFQATVDGTNGNTVLHPVRARLGKSEFEVSGSIDRSALETHKTILLNAKSRGARLQDFLEISVKAAEPPMRGRIGFDTRVKVPPGETDVVQRIELQGDFTLKGVTFASQDVQGKIAGLSHRAEGDPRSDADVTADFNGHLTLRNGLLNLPDLGFQVPGVDVRLAGQYTLKTGDLNFDGTAKLDASVSQMTTGIKRILLKPIDPLFRRDGAGTVLPIEIRGTRGEPSFRLDIGKILHRK